MCTEGRSEGGKDRMQFRFLRRQSFCAQFTDAIFHSSGNHGLSTANRKVFLSVQKHSFLETSIWTWIIRS